MSPFVTVDWIEQSENLTVTSLLFYLIQLLPCTAPVSTFQGPQWLAVDLASVPASLLKWKV